MNETPDEVRGEALAAGFGAVLGRGADPDLTELACEAAAESAYAAGVANERARVVADLRYQRIANASDWQNGWNRALESAAQRFERSEHLGD